MTINSFSWMNHVQQTIINGFAGYGAASIIGVNPKLGAKVSSVLTFTMPFIVATAVELFKMQSKLLRLGKLAIYSIQLISIITCYRYKLVGIKLTLFLNGIAFLNYYT